MALPMSASTSDGDSTPETPHNALLLNRRDRPPTMDVNTSCEHVRVPLNPAKVSRRESKFGLRGIFRRNKVEGGPVLDEFPVISSTTSSSDVAMEIPKEGLHIQSLPIECIPALPGQRVIQTASDPTPKTSRMGLKSLPLGSQKSRPKSSPKQNIKSAPRPTTRTSTAWDPPPLFQAYPQAIKHSTLSASTLSADTILRINNHQRNNSLRDEYAQTALPADAKDSLVTKNERARSKHRRQVSGSISKAEWTQKIFVLVTSGYLLQYASEGSFDRLPEKMMQLGKDSVAFASDAIPGKHWVLQISHAMADDGTPASDSRSILSRLAFRGFDHKRSASSLLLVLDSAEDMDIWIAAVRREIEALGGKQHVSETGKPKTNENVKQLRAQPSHRYLVTRNPDRFSTPSPRTPYFGPPPWVPDDSLQEQLADAASAMLNPPSFVRPPTSSGSIANSITSHDGKQLESLRDSTHRLSHLSSGQRTLLTSQCSSPASSPTRKSNSTSDGTPKTSAEDVRPKFHPSAVNERQISAQANSAQLVVTALKSACAEASSDLPLRAARASSPPALNFSVPSSSARRYSAFKPFLTDQQVATSSLSISTSRGWEPMLKGRRKAPPASLNVHRQLSPVKDSPSPALKGDVGSPTEPLRNAILPTKFTRRPRSRSSLRLTQPTATTARRVSSFTGGESPEFGSTLHFSKKQSPFNDYARVCRAPLRTPPPPPTVQPIPMRYSPPDSGKEIERHVAIQKLEGTDNISPLTALPTPKTKLRRPASMQIQPSLLTRSRSPYATRTPPNLYLPPTTSLPVPPHPKALMPPSLERLNLPSKSLANRRSMPMLLKGPPPVPPPDCALPPLPMDMKASMAVKTPIKI